MRVPKWVVVTTAADGTLSIWGRDRCCDNAACPFPSEEEAQKRADEVFPDQAEYQVLVMEVQGI